MIARPLLIVAGLTFLIDAPCLWAGMPMPPHLSEIGKMRLQNLSFFLAAFFVSALAVQLLWNFLRRDWPRLPRLTYMKSLALVTLWGLLFVVVLTMISGARELLTPGAWQPRGATYELKSNP